MMMQFRERRKKNLSVLARGNDSFISFFSETHKITEYMMAVTSIFFNDDNQKIS
jgi:hypothetical protein